MQAANLRPMWHKPDGWADKGITLNAWIQDLPTHMLKQLWNLRDIEDADSGCFLIEAVQLEMQYRGEGSYVAL